MSKEVKSHQQNVSPLLREENFSYLQWKRSENSTMVNWNHLTQLDLAGVQCVEQILITQAVYFVILKLFFFFLISGASSLGSVPRHRQISSQATILSQLLGTMRPRYQTSTSQPLTLASSRGSKLLRAYYASDFPKTN